MSRLMTLAFEMPELPQRVKDGLLVMGIVLVTLSMLLGIRKRHRRRQQEPSAQDRIEQFKDKQAVRGDLEHLMVEIEQLAKRFGAQLDAKTVQMEHLIDEADRKIAELKQLEQARDNAPGPHGPQASPLRPQASLNPQPPNPDDALKRSVCDLADQGHDPVEIAQRLDEHIGKIELILALRKT